MAILQALAGGTIIYVVVFEVLERERSKNVSGLAQLFFVVLGFCVLMMVEILGKVLNITYPNILIKKIFYPYCCKYTALFNYLII